MAPRGLHHQGLFVGQLAIGPCRRLARFCISTTSRYLSPPMLNTTRLLLQMLALAYWPLTSYADAKSP